MNNGATNVIQRPCTSINLSANKTSAYIGEMITFTTVAQPYTQSFPIEIGDQNHNLIGTCATYGGICTVYWNTTGSTDGIYYISATTAGCGPTPPISIILLQACTSIYTSANKTSAYVGEMITLDITIEPQTQSFPVEIRDQNNNMIGFCTTSLGRCAVSWNTTGFVAGIYNISVTTVWCSSISQIPITLLPACTSINIYANEISAYIGEMITFTAVAQPYAQSYPVEIRDHNNHLIGTRMTSLGTCVTNWHTAGLAAGTYYISATTIGCSSASPLPITLLPTCTSIDISASKTYAYLGETIILTVTTHPSTPSYIVEVRYQNNSLIETCMTSGGTCTINWNTRGLTTGTYYISAIANGCSMTSQTPITLLPICTLVNITPDNTSANIGDSIIFNVNIAPISQNFNVQLTDQDNNYIGNVCTTSNGICSITWDTKGFFPKQYVITATIIDEAAGHCISTIVDITLQLPLLERESTMVIGLLGVSALGIMMIYNLKKQK